MSFKTKLRTNNFRSSGPFDNHRLANFPGARSSIKLLHQNDIVWTLKPQKLLLVASLSLKKLSQLQKPKSCYTVLWREGKKHLPSCENKLDNIRFILILWQICFVNTFLVVSETEHQNFACVSKKVHLTRRQATAALDEFIVGPPWKWSPGRIRKLKIRIFNAYMPV